MARPRFFLLAGAALAALTAGSPLAAQDLHTNLPQPGVLRVCADPDNLPLSNKAGDGFENKIAELIAREWNAKLEYAWWPVRRGYFSRALNGRYCDVALQAPFGLDMAAVTKPYYRSSYVIVTRKDSGLDIMSLADPRLRKLKIGVNLLNSDAENTPPAMALSRYGVVGNLVGFTTMYTDTERPEDIIEAVVDKNIDVAIVWGPLAGYFAKHASAPLVVTPLAARDSLTDMPFAFNIAMGVRRRDSTLRDSLQTLLDRKGPEIRAILEEYGVPLQEIVTESPPSDDDDEPARRAAAPAATPKAARAGAPKAR